MCKTVRILRSTLWLVLVCMGTQGMAQNTEALKRFFLDFEAAAVDKDVMRLNAYIYPFKYADSAWNYRLEDVQDQMLQGVLRADTTHRGRAAFSLPALRCLVEAHLAEFRPCNLALYQEFSAHPHLGQVFQKFRPGDIFVFDQESTDTHVIVFQTKTGLQLLAWKNLNGLLPCKG